MPTYGSLPRLLVGLVAIALSACAHPRVTPATPVVDTATVRGRVVDRMTGRPLAHAVVRAVLPERNREQRLTTADKSGRYELKDLRAGRYYLTASQVGYLTLNYGQTRPAQNGKPLELIAGQVLDTVEFGLFRGSVITGRVVDEYGDPVPNATVAAHQVRFLRTGREITPGLGRRQATDDKGMYRIFDLPPARYVVSAAVRSPQNSADDPDRTGYAVTFFPGTTSLSEAQRVAIGVGQTIERVNIAVVPATLASITGTVVSSSGEPMTGGTVFARDRTRAKLGARSAIRSDGTFTLSGLAPGEYILYASGPQRIQTGDQAITAVTVEGRDVAGIRLAFIERSSLSGRIIVDAAGATAILAAHSSIVMNSQEGENPSGSAPINRDLAFQMKVRPGRHIVTLPNLPPGWFLRSVRVNGVDVTDAPIEVRPNETVDGIDVELTNHPTIVSGLVTEGFGTAVKDSTVVIFARDERLWFEGSRHIGKGQTNEDGHFTISGLPAGDYYAAVVDQSDTAHLNDPDVLGLLKAGAVTFSLSADESKVLEEFRLRNVREPRAGSWDTGFAPLRREVCSWQSAAVASES